MVPWRMDGDQQLNFYYLDEGSIQWPWWIDSLFSPSLPKTYTGRNQGRDSGRNQTFLFQEVLLILDMYSIPLLHLLHVKNRSPSWIKLRIPYTVRFATVCNILHKQQKLNMWHILHIMHISRWYLYGYSRLVQHSCRELPEPPWRLANESRELVFCGSDASIWSR